MNTLLKRVKAIEQAIKARDGSLFTVYYKVGNTRRIQPGDAIPLCLYEADKIEHFEEDQGGTNNGIIEGLCNALLLSGEDQEGREVV